MNIDDRTLKVLDYINSIGISMGEVVDISKPLNEIFPYYTPKHEGESREINGNITTFIMSLHKYLLFDPAMDTEINDPRNGINTWFTTFRVRYTDDTFKALSDYQSFKEQSLVNQSIINTNESVQRTNDLLVESAKDQNTINSTIASNTGFQTSYMSRQTSVLYFTAAFALSALIISYKSCTISQLTYDRDTSKGQLEQLLKKKDSTIHTLQRQLIEIKKDSPRVTGAKKVEIKKS
jgi:hypothetical protein